MKRGRALFRLLDGRELSASELASSGAASPQAASAHLAKLVDGGLICARNAGRRRFFRLASSQVAHAIEALASIAPVAPVNSLIQHTTMQRLREARSCYDHLAGRLGVALTEALVQRRVIRPHEDQYKVTAAGEKLLTELGIDLDEVPAQSTQSRAVRIWRGPRTVQAVIRFAFSAMIATAVFAIACAISPWTSVTTCTESSIA